MSRFAVTGMVLVLVMALMIISLSGIDSPDRITGFAASGSKGQAETTLPSTYSVVPISKLSPDYSFSEYPSLVSEAKRLVSKCRGKENVTGCLETYLKRGWSIAGSEETVYLFNVKGSQKLKIYDAAEKNVVEKAVLYRFALDFS
jgi:hypothetical protein